MNQKKTNNVLALRKKIQNYSFFISDKIGNGYSSCVYHGRNDLTNEPVAIKVIDMNKLKPINRDLLISEISILRTLRNFPNLLNIHEIYTTKNNTYIISELCQTDLHHAIRRANSIEESQACEYMKQLLEGYKVVYELGIVHRDLKPANILLSEAGILKLADFGFAIKIEQLVSPCPYNVGSPLYMAPQSLKNSEYSYKSDIWSIGAIFYEMLTGETPWKSRNEKQLEWKIRSESIDKKLIGKSFSAATKEFLLKCLKYNRDERMSPKEIISFKFDNELKLIKNLNGGAIQSSLKYLNYDKKIHPIINKQKLQNNIVCYQINEQTQNCHNPEVNLIKDNKYINPNKSFKIKQQYQIEYNQQHNNQNLGVDLRFASKILISQIHFCRFLYKMIHKLKMSLISGLLRDSADQILNVQRTYIGLIKEKLLEVANFGKINFLNIQQHQEYAMSRTFKSIEKIAQDYIKKYQIELNMVWRENNVGEDKIDEEYNYYQTKSTLKIINILFNKLTSQINHENNYNQQQYKNDIVNIDYLMTCKQLLDLSGQKNYQKFSKKSKIEDIVEGKITQIDYRLYLKIIQKANKMLSKQSQIVNNALIYNLTDH